MEPLAAKEVEVGNMGQYFIIVNLTKGEYVQSRGAMKLREIAMDPFMAHVLFGLLAHGNGRGGGDFVDHEDVGRWEGDRIVIAGDYGDDELYIRDAAEALGLEVTEDDLNMNLYNYMVEHGVDVSQQAYEMVEHSMECSRCGRPRRHWVADCLASTHMNGSVLDD